MMLSGAAKTTLENAHKPSNGVSAHRRGANGALCGTPAPANREYGAHIAQIQWSIAPSRTTARDIDARFHGFRPAQALFSRLSAPQRRCGARPPHGAGQARGCAWARGAGRGGSVVAHRRYFRRGRVKVV